MSIFKPNMMARLNVKIVHISRRVIDFITPALYRYVGTMYNVHGFNGFSCFVSKNSVFEFEFLEINIK